MNPADKNSRMRHGLLWACFCALLAGIAGLSLMVETHHPHSWLEERVPFFWSLFAFLAALVIICLSKWLAKAGLEAGAGCYDLPLAPEDERP